MAYLSLENGVGGAVLIEEIPCLFFLVYQYSGYFTQSSSTVERISPLLMSKS